jgi:hypothetical protein
LGASPISARNRAARWRSLQPTARATSATRAVPREARRRCQAWQTSAATQWVDEPPQTAIEQPEPLRPARRRLHALLQLGAEPADQVGGVHVDVGQLPGRNAEQGTGAERAQRELDAGLRPVVLDDGGPCVQAAHQRVVPVG